MPAGRPTDYSQDLGNLICDLVSDGVSLRKIDAMKNMPAKTTICRWRHDNPEFRDHYARAREDFADSIVDEILDIAVSATPADVSCAKLHIDSIKWVAARFNHAYTDKKIVDNNTVISYESMSEDDIDRRLAELGVLLEQSLED